MKYTENALVFLFCLFGQMSDALSAYPEISGEVAVELQTEWAVDADDPDEERHNTFLNAEMSAELELTENVSVEGTFLLEPVRSFNAGENTAFAEEGAFVEEFLVKYEKGPLEAVVRVGVVHVLEGSVSLALYQSRLYQVTALYYPCVAW